MTELFCGHLDQMEEIARHALRHSAKHDHGVPSAITAGRDGRAILSIAAPPIDQLFHLLTQILVMAMDADRLDITFDTYTDDEEPRDSLIVAHFCKYEGRPSIGERNLEYVMNDGQVEIRRRDDIAPLLFDSILATIIIGTPSLRTDLGRMFPGESEKTAQLKSDLLLVARLEQSFPVQCMIPVDNEKIADIMALSDQMN